MHRAIITLTLVGLVALTIVSVIACDQGDIHIHLEYTDGDSWVHRNPAFQQLQQDVQALHDQVVSRRRMEAAAEAAKIDLERQKADQDAAERRLVIAHQQSMERSLARAQLGPSPWMSWLFLTGFVFLAGLTIWIAIRTDRQRDRELKFLALMMHRPETAAAGREPGSRFIERIPFTDGERGRP